MPYLSMAMPVDPHAPGEALVDIGVEPAIAQHVGVHHAAAQDLEPVAALADLHLGARAVALHVDFHRGLGEREEARAEAQRHVGDLEEGLEELLQHPAQLADMARLVDDEAFDLMEHRRVRLVAVVPIGAARASTTRIGGSIGRREVAGAAGFSLVCFIDADLHRRGVGAQHALASRRAPAP